MILDDDRDIKLLQAVHKYQFLTTKHVKDLIFTDRHISICRRRLGKFVKNGYLGTLSLKNEKGLLQGNVYYLKPKSYTALNLEYSRKSHPKKLLSHTVETISVNIHFDKIYADKTIDYTFKEYQTERETNVLENGKQVFAIYDKFYSTGVQEYISIRPDSKFIFERLVNSSPKSTAIFIEIDRGTENLAQLRKKVKSYYEYFANSGKKFMKKFKVTESRFVVLFITTTQRRIDNILEGLKLEYGLDLFVFTTFEDFYKTEDMTEEIWRKKGGQKVGFLKKH